jgi:hypothetical protein
MPWQLLRALTASEPQALAQELVAQLSLGPAAE